MNVAFLGKSKEDSLCPEHSMICISLGILLFQTTHDIHYPGHFFANLLGIIT
jgi:hypothetical protein